jgi:hypothetical protein
LDPITLLATASAIWSGVKKASELVQDAETVWGQLGKFCGVADQLEQAIQKGKNSKPQKPSLFGELKFGDDTKEAFDVFAAEQKLHAMELEIRHEFLYGALSDPDLKHYGGMDGYQKFIEMRRKIRADRIRMKQEQERMQAEFWDNVRVWGIGGAVVAAGIGVMYFAITKILEYV